MLPQPGDTPLRGNIHLVLAPALNAVLTNGSFLGTYLPAQVRK